MIVLIRGGGDLASGVAVRLYRGGLRVVITELAQPLALRRTVAFAEAVYNGETSVEGITARVVNDPTDMLKVLNVLSKKQIPVLVDPGGSAIALLHPTVVVDGRMLKQTVELIPERVNLVIGLGPGFSAGENCHAVVETQRGHALGRVIWQGAGSLDSGIPEWVLGKGPERVLRAPASGKFEALSKIGDHVESGQVVADVAGMPVSAAFKGVMRGLLYSGLSVDKGAKIGDVDPRDDPAMCQFVSDKALAVGGGVLEAILSRYELRASFWQ